MAGHVLGGAFITLVPECLRPTKHSGEPSYSVSKKYILKYLCDAGDQSQSIPHTQNTLLPITTPQSQK